MRFKTNVQPRTGTIANLQIRKTVLANSTVENIFSSGKFVSAQNKVLKVLLNEKSSGRCLSLVLDDGLLVGSGF